MLVIYLNTEKHDIMYCYFTFNIVFTHEYNTDV